MKNKGFTLIELLAVILILGIIALIAVPTVSSVVEQARKGAFENSVRNVVKAAETKCTMELLSGNGVTNTYSILNGELNHPLDIKGSLPDNATIYVSNSCDVRIYAKSDKYFITNDDVNDNESFKNVDVENLPVYDTIYFAYTTDIHANLEDVHRVNSGDAMFHREEYESKIVNVSMVYGVPFTDGLIHWDFSKNGDGTVITWLEPNGDNYDLYIGSKGIIQPTRTDAWFGHMPNVENFKFDNIDTSKTTYMSYMFSGAQLVKKLDISKFNTKSVEGFGGAFNNMTLLEEFITGPDFVGNSLKTLSQAFRRDKSLKKLDLSSLKTTNKFYSIGYAFEGCKLLEELDISNLDMSKVTSTAGAFNNNPKLQKVYVSETWKGNVETGKEYVAGVPDGENIFIRK